MDEGYIPKDLLYGVLAIGTRHTGRPILHYKDVCIQDLKVCGINPASLEAEASSCLKWRTSIKAGIQSSER